MTNEWIQWSDSRIRTPLRGSSCQNFLNNNNYTANNSVNSLKYSGMGIKTHAAMKVFHRTKGKLN